MLAGLMADQARGLPAAGGTILDRWPDIASIVAPQLPDHAAAVAFHPETGQLDLRPDSPAYTTQLRLISARIIRSQRGPGTGTMRTIRVVPPGTTPTDLPDRRKRRRRRDERRRHGEGARSRAPAVGTAEAAARAVRRHGPQARVVDGAAARPRRTPAGLRRQRAGDRMTGELSGVDLARQALVAARQAAKKNGATQTKKPKRRTTTVVRRDGREPLGLGAAIGMMMTERGMAAPAAGGNVLADFDTILAAVVPELAGRMKAVAFEAETGRLDVIPDVPAAGTHLRWSAPKLIAAANEKVSGANVRALDVRAPAPVKAGPATAAAELADSRPHPPHWARIRRRAIARPSPPTAPPGTPPGSTPAPRSRRPPNDSSATGSGNPRSISPTAAKS
ncbi:hypothetical protein ACPCUK_37290 [Streptomyces arboris]|uniref:hypothetical protein n=1 Tax=Streptomyces arboris TaxID=2600619 RepID=UPI003C2B5779